MDLKTLAKLAKGAYLDQPPGAHAMVSHGGAFAAVHTTPSGDVIIAFRGTEPTSLEDIAADLDIVGEKVGDVGNFHGGLFEYTRRLVPDLRRYTEDEDCFVTCTGHSMGGAMALIFSALCHDQVNKCVTFGAPKVCSQEWAKEMASYDLQVVRVVNDNDLVTRLPPGDLYVHVGDTVFLASKGTRQQRIERSSLLRHGVADAIADHGISEYIDALNGKTDPPTALRVGVGVVCMVLGLLWVFG